METLKAIARALKICPKAQDASTFGCVRLCPAVQGARAHVYATDGSNFIRVVLDEGVDVPDALLPSGALRPITRHKGAVDVVGLGHGVVELITDSSSTKIQGENHDKFTLCPVIPFLATEFPWKSVKRVVHAAALEKYDSQFAVLRFAPSHVEAYDGTRFARVALDNDWTGLVSTRVFAGFPAGKALYGRIDEHAFFQVGDETRIGTIQRQFFPDTETGIPVEFAGNQVIVNAVTLRDAIQCGLGVSSQDYVRIEIVDDVVNVYPFGIENVEGKDVLRSYANTYMAGVAVQASLGREVVACVLNLDAKYVYKALQQVSTPNVVLGYGDNGDEHQPLRIESGGFTACIWQLVM